MPRRCAAATAVVASTRAWRRALRYVPAVAGLRVDRPVVVVPREAGMAGGLRAERDGEQPPALAQLGRDPARREVRLGAAAPAVAGDVDAHGEERRGAQPGVHRLLRGRHALVEPVAGEVPRSRHVVRVRAHRDGERDRGQQPGQDSGRGSGDGAVHDDSWGGGSGTLTPPVTPATCVPTNYRRVVTAVPGTGGSDPDREDGEHDRAARFLGEHGGPAGSRVARGDRSSSWGGGGCSPSTSRAPWAPPTTTWPAGWPVSGRRR